MEQLLNELEMLLEKDIRTVVAKGDIAPADYQCLDTAIDILKDVETVKAMWKYDTDENGVSGMVSGRMPSGRGYGINSYEQGGGNGWNSGYYPMNSYGNSYARGRSSVTGQYVSRDDEMSSKLHNMMNNAQTEQERMTIQRIMNEIGI